MRTAGLIDLVQLGGPGGSVVWTTYAGVGQSKPDLYRQTTRHEIAVAAASARYASPGLGEHARPGVGSRDDGCENRFVVDDRGHRDAARPWLVRPDLSAHVHAAAIGKADVEQHHLG